MHFSILKRRTRAAAPHGHQLYSPPILNLHSCSDICSQSGVSHDFLIWLVESVLEIRVGRDPRGDGVPSAEIYAGVAGGVVDAVAEEI